MTTFVHMPTESHIYILIVISFIKLTKSGRKRINLKFYCYKNACSKLINCVFTSLLTICEFSLPDFLCFSFIFLFYYQMLYFPNILQTFYFTYSILIILYNN